MKSLLMLAVLASSAAAAAPVPGGKGANEPATKSAALLLQQRKVQKELKLTGDQRIALVDGLADIEEATGKLREKLARQPNLTAELYDKLEAEHQKKIESFLVAAAGKVLTADGRHRLMQIDRQVRGLESFADPAVQKVLGFTERQKKSLEKAVKEQDEKVAAYLNQLGNDDADNQKEEVLKHRTEQMKSLVAGFTAEQQVLWKSLLGEPVKGFDAIEMWFALLESEDILVP